MAVHDSGAMVAMSETAVRRRRIPVSTWIILGVATAWLMTQVVAGAVIWARAFSSAQQFDRASICITYTCDPSQLLSVTGTVVRASQDQHWADVSGLGKATPQRVELWAGGGSSQLRPGDQVHVAFWHGAITELSNDQATSQAVDDPDIKAYTALVRLAMPATLLLAFAAFLVSLRWKPLRGKGQLIAGWIIISGFSYETLLLIADESVFFPLPILLALAGMLMYTAVVVTRHWRRRKKAAAGTRPARVP